MKKSIKTIGIIVTMAIIAIGSFYLGTTQAETITKIKDVEKVVEVVPNGYIDMNTEEFYNNFVDMRQVVDFTATEYGLQLYLDDGSGYYWER